MSLSSEKRKNILRQLADGEITVADASFLFNGVNNEQEEEAAYDLLDPDRRIQIT